MEYLLQFTETSCAKAAVQIMSPRHGPEELVQHFLPYEEEAKKIGWQIPERPIIRMSSWPPLKKKAEE